MAATASTAANPFKITGGAVSTSTEITAKTMTIQAIVWYGITTAGHLLSVIDRGGNTIWKCRAVEAGNDSIIFPLGLPVSGVSCDDMDSGELYIYGK